MATSAGAESTPGLCEARNISQAFTLPKGQQLRVLEHVNDFACADRHIDVRQQLRVLEHVNVTVGASEVVALLGPSGSGKSTILRMLAGLIAPTHGEVFYHSHALRGLNPGVAIVFQSFALYPWMTVTENVKVVLEVL